jgi:hypothetical protein
MWHCIARMHDQSPFTSLSMPSNDSGENISDIRTWSAVVNISPLGMASTAWNPWGLQTNVSIDFGL